jgi:hypothetical protein
MTDQIDVQEADVVQEAPQPEAPSEIVEEARLFGWKAPDEWQGDKPAGYIDDPARFVERIQGSRIFKTMAEKIDAKERELDSRLARVDGVYQKAVERERKEYQDRLAEIQAGQRKAVEMADTREFDRLEALKRNVAPPTPAEPEQDPVVKEYVTKNEWAQDVALRAEGAQAIDAAQRSGMRFNGYGEQLAYAESVMKRKYPHLFQAPALNVPKTARVDGGGLAGGIGGQSGFDKLPSDAKTAFKRMVAQNLFTDDAKGRAQYLEDYNNA